MSSKQIVKILQRLFFLHFYWAGKTELKAEEKRKSLEFSLIQSNRNQVFNKASEDWIYLSFVPRL